MSDENLKRKVQAAEDAYGEFLERAAEAEDRATSSLFEVGPFPMKLVDVIVSDREGPLESAFEQHGDRVVVHVRGRVQREYIDVKLTKVDPEPDIPESAFRDTLLGDDLRAHLGQELGVPVYGPPQDTGNSTVVHVEHRLANPQEVQSMSERWSAWSPVRFEPAPKKRTREPAITTSYAPRL